MGWCGGEGCGQWAQRWVREIGVWHVRCGLPQAGMNVNGCGLCLHGYREQVRMSSVWTREQEEELATLYQRYKDEEGEMSVES